jgi:hypothetical protein
VSALRQVEPDGGEVARIETNDAPGVGVDVRRQGIAAITQAVSIDAGRLNRAKCVRQQIRKECLGVGRVRRHHYPLRRMPLGFPGGKRRYTQGTMPFVVMLNDLLNTNDAFEVAKKTLEALAEPSYGSCRSASRDSRCRARSSRTAD